MIVQGTHKAELIKVIRVETIEEDTTHQIPTKGIYQYYTTDGRLIGQEDLNTNNKIIGKIGDAYTTLVNNYEHKV